MPGQKISALTAVGSAQLTDTFPVVQSGTTYKETNLQLATLLGFSSQILLPIAGGTGVSSPTAKTIPVAQGASAFTFLGPLTNGQLLIGSTGANPVAAAITQGSGITVTNGAGTITIANSGLGAFSWTEVTGTTQALSANSGFIANNAALVTLTLPVTCAIGKEISIAGLGAGGWIVAQSANQQIHHLTSTTIGIGGSLASTARYDTVTLLCVVANLEFNVISYKGTLTVV